MPETKKGKKKVLIIDDNLGDLKLMEEALNDAGYDVYVKDRGISGIKVAGTLKPNLIILDLHLPDINGILAYRIIKAGEHPNMKVVITSGVKNSSLLEALDDMNDEGVIPDVFIEKSHDFLSLQNMVNTIL